MARIILSACVSIPGEKSTVQVQPSPGVNILCGNNAEDIFWSLAGIVDIYSSNYSPACTTVNAELRWSDGVIYGVCSKVSNAKNQMVVDYIKGLGEKDLRYLVKCLHKQRFRDIRDRLCLFNGCQLDNSRMLGESEAILEAFHGFIERVPAQKNGRPLFLCNFLERLDGSVDLLPLFDELATPNRQAFILLPEGCAIEHMENTVKTVKLQRNEESV